MRDLNDLKDKKDQKDLVDTKSMSEKSDAAPLRPQPGDDGQRKEAQKPDVQKPFAKRPGALLAAALFLFWMLLTGRFGLRMMITGLLAVGITLSFYRRFLSYFNLEPVAATGLLRVVRFAFRVFQDIFISAWAHMKRVVYGSPPPELFTLELTLEAPMMVALIANAITLTPGSMTVEVNGKVLTVLAFVDSEEEVEAFRRQIHTRYEQLLMGGRSRA